MFVGIDYSINSPAICMSTSEHIEDCHFYAFASNKKQESISHSQVNLTKRIKKFDNRIDKYIYNAETTIKILLDNNINHVSIEGYSYNSISSSTIQIAENGGILRYYLNKNNISWTEYAPTEIKKFASGRGNAKKDLMYHSWISVGGLDLSTILDTENLDSNPLSDIVDSYFIMKMGMISQ